MGIYKKSLIVILTILFFIMSSSSTFYGYEQRDIAVEILKSIEGSIKEYKVVGSFYTYESKDEVYDEIVKRMINIIGQVKINEGDKYKFEMNYGGNECSGDIVILPYKDQFRVTLSISIYGENLNIDEKNIIKTKVMNVLSIFDSNVEYSLCVKSKIMNNTIDEVREIIIDKLSLYKAENTDEVKINNGYSIVGYTGMYDKKVILGKDIDFNCAIVRYSSGCYLIMGEPEITISY